jgi:hypothetical protein
MKPLKIVQRGEEKKSGEERIIEGAKFLKVFYMHVCGYHHETALYD